MAIVAESFLPECNGVTNSVLRVLEHLRRRGHTAVVIAPGIGPDRYLDVAVERVPAVSLPLYRSLAVGLPSSRIEAVLAEFRPDVVHLAAPAVLGATAGRAARRLGLPVLAVYQTDLAGFARRYGLGALTPAVWSVLKRIHNQADLTLAPSTMACWQLRNHGVHNVERWARGVDRERFDPRHRDELYRRRIGRGARLVVGYVGRLAAEKQVERLAHVLDLPGVRVVVVGDGPSRTRLGTQLPGAEFLGFLSGEALSRAMASIDVFVHTGSDETFCQAVQEALASGVPVVAPASGGPLDLVRHGDNGFLYPDENAALMRGAVEALRDDDALRAAMGRRARHSVEDRSWVDIGDELFSHYSGLIGTKARPLVPAPRRWVA